MLQYRLYKVLLVACMATGLLVATGCKKEARPGAPVIDRLRAISAAPNDSTLTRTGPGQTIVIQGNNLATTRELYFNGYPAPFNSALLTDENVVVTVPADMPFATLNQNDLNKVRLVTAYGEVTITFPVVPPPPVIYATTHEYARAGERIILAGNNFFYVDKVVFPGNIEVTTNLVANDPGTFLEVTVPAGITQAGPLKVINRYGTGTSLLQFNDFVTGMVCNFDAVNSLNNWANANITDNVSNFPGSNGKYAHLVFGKIPAQDFVWYGGGRSLNIEEKKTWVPTTSLSEPLDNYAVKFELYAKDAWKGGSIFILKDYDWKFVARFEPWKAIPEFKTGGWKTVVIPFSTFKTKANNTDGTGDPAKNLTELVGAPGTGGINLLVINNSAAVLDTFNLAIDNIRIMKIQ